MLLHIIPTFYNRLNPSTTTLIELSIPELSFKLKTPLELATCTPYANKSILVGCHKEERGDGEGFLIETTTRLQSFTLVSRWAIGARGVSTHIVHNDIIDNDFEAITQKMRLWGETILVSGTWPNRWPKAYPYSPLAHTPRMSFQRGGDETNRLLLRDCTDSKGIIFLRSESFKLPTVEKNSVLCEMDGTRKVPKVSLVQHGDSFELNRR